MQLSDLAGDLGAITRIEWENSMQMIQEGGGGTRTLLLLCCRA